MELTRTTMVERMLQSDSSYNGRYVTAVKTTGIYCLPGCRARKPKPENTEFFATPEAAQAAGYRPCKLCRPGDFYQGLNPDEALIEQLVAAMAGDPARYRDVDDLAAAASMGQTKLFELFRLHYHTTPTDMLIRLRIAAARRALLETNTSITAIASDVGFASLSAFHENFRKYTAMSPSDYRRMREASAFVVALPKDYLAERILGFLGRDSGSLTDRVDGATWSSTVRLTAAVGAHLRVTIRPGFAQCDVLDPVQVDAAGMGRIYAHVMSSLGLSHDPLRFEVQVEKSPELAPLIHGQRGLRIPMVGEHFDFLAWAIIGQQITLAFAYTMRRRLIEMAGQQLATGLFLAPTSETVAALADEDLMRLGFSRAKAAYLIGAAQAVLDGRLPLEQLAGKSATRIERLLLATRGIGPWTANYMLMRSYGFLDCVPVGDSGLTASLQQFFKLTERPDRQVTMALMEPFRPYRSLATFHLWQRNTHPQSPQPAHTSVAVAEGGDAGDLGR